MNSNRCTKYLRGAKSTHDEDLPRQATKNSVDWQAKVKTLQSAMSGNLQNALLKAELRLLEQRIHRLENSQHLHQKITTLKPSHFRLKREIPLTISFNGDDYIATFFDAKTSATGDTSAESLWNLRDIIIQKFERLIQLPAESLGPMPRQQLAVLREFIEE